MARDAEALGFDSVWILDHQLIESDTPGWEGVEHGAWDCWSILAAIAASTSRIELGPFVSNTLLRNPALTAKMADTVDEISGGRFILGLGAGWHQHEIEAFGFPYDHRASRFEEAIKIIHPLAQDRACRFRGHLLLRARLRAAAARSTAGRTADSDRHQGRAGDARCRQVRR